MESKINPLNLPDTQWARYRHHVTLSDIYTTRIGDIASTPVILLNELSVSAKSDVHQIDIQYKLGICALWTQNARPSCKRPIGRIRGRGCDRCRSFGPFLRMEQSDWVNGHIEALGFRVGCGEACVTRGISMDEIIGGIGGNMPKSKQYTLKR